MAEELVTNGMRVPLEKDSLFVHDTLCENLKSFLGRDDPDDQSPRGVTERAQKMLFYRCVKVDELFLGKLEGYTWDVKADVEFSIKNSMNCMTRAPDGKMAVGSGQGRIHLYSPDGELQQTVLKDVRISKIGFLSNGRSVVRDTDNTVSIYTPEWEKLDVTFETMSYDEGGHGGLTADKDDNIHMSYMKAKKIQVFFSPQGGKTVREIMCDDDLPWQIFFLQTKKNVIPEDSTYVVCIDGKGMESVQLQKGEEELNDMVEGEKEKTLGTNTMTTFHQISSQKLECPICLTLFNQPKLLACSHTFCKECLDCVFQNQSNQQTVTCPVCRKGTPVPSGEVSKLQTNEPLKSLVDEVKAKSPTCTVCEMEEESPTVSYCQDCGKCMCKSCEIGHLAWKPFSNHEVVPMGEVLSGNISFKRRRKCNTHPSADEECFCTDCKEYICIACGMLEHMQAGHQLEKASTHEEKVINNIKELKENVKSKNITIENYVNFIEKQRNEISNVLQRMNNDIDKTYKEYMKILSNRREAVKCQVKRWSEKFEKELQVMEEESLQTIRQMNAMEELVTNGMKALLEKDSLFVHDTLCENLKSFLGRDDPDYKSPRGVTERAQNISFRRYVEVNELCLGELLTSCHIKADVKLPVKDSMNCITRAPEGKMAVGSHEEGIHLYSPDGELQQTVLQDVKIQGIGFLSDGRSVVRNTKNNISLYTPQWGKLEVTFETMNYVEGHYGGLTVDRDDNIYVSYRKPKKIQVFTPQGGKAVREIMCGGYVPQQLSSFHTTGKLILRDSSTVVCLDGNGKKENVLTNNDISVYTAVCRDDSVIVAWVKHKEGLVSIDRYTSDLEHVHNIITDFKIQRSERGNWYYLQEYESGEIAFCTTESDMDRSHRITPTSCARTGPERGKSIIVKFSSSSI
ncbi:uncharacterized protein [Diadema antillarum]|uniref:uncharacterized protein n=1 Tax=Diadema antillarum TaxID=105358 RepID=UPI003A857CEC